MSDSRFVKLFVAVLILFTAIGIVAVLWPSKFLRFVQNPLQPDTPINRVSVRALGVFFCLFVLMMISEPFEGFHRNILVALTVSPIILGIFQWILWRYSSLRQVNRRYLAGDAEEPQWELRMSIAFFSLLCIIVVAAFLLAAKGIYHK